MKRGLARAVPAAAQGTSRSRHTCAVRRREDLKLLLVVLVLRCTGLRSTWKGNVAYYPVSVGACCLVDHQAQKKTRRERAIFPEQKSELNVYRPKRTVVCVFGVASGTTCAAAPIDPASIDIDPASIARRPPTKDR